MHFFIQRIRYSLVLGLLLFTSLAYTQTSSKGIYVVNAISKVPVPDAFAQSEDLTFNVAADENGYISLRNLPATVNELILSRIGFERKLIDLSTLPFLNNSAVISIDSKVASLDEVKVVATTSNNNFKITKRS